MENETDIPAELAETAGGAIETVRVSELDPAMVVVTRVGGAKTSVAWPSQTSEAEAVQTWINDGNTILEAIALPVDLKAYAASVRWVREVGGIDVGGSLILTDRDSQGLINGAWNLAKEEPAETIDFKGASGWVELDSATMSAIGIAVGRHVRGLFRIERQVADAIVAGVITTTAEVDAAFAAAD